jgi:hypothetical protein
MIGKSVQRFSKRMTRKQQADQAMAIRTIAL